MFIRLGLASHFLSLMTVKNGQKCPFFYAAPELDFLHDYEIVGQACNDGDFLQ